MDIIGLQECTQRMLVDVLQALPDFTAPFADATTNQEQILYRKERFEMLGGKQETFTGTTNSYGVLKLKEKTSARTFVIASTHLDWQGSGFGSCDTTKECTFLNTRPNQMHKICDEVRDQTTSSIDQNRFL